MLEEHGRRQAHAAPCGPAGDDGFLVEPPNDAEAFEVGVEPRHACVVAGIDIQPLPWCPRICGRGVGVVLPIVIVDFCSVLILGVVGIVAQVLVGVFDDEFQPVAWRRLPDRKSVV